MNTSKTMNYLRLAMNQSRDDRELAEVRILIKKAMDKLDFINKKKSKKQTQTQHQQWWNNIVSGVAAQPMSREAAALSLKNLEAMITDEQKKLMNLDQQTSDMPNSLLKD